MMFLILLCVFNVQSLNCQDWTTDQECDVACITDFSPNNSANENTVCKTICGPDCSQKINSVKPCSTVCTLFDCKSKNNCNTITCSSGCSYDKLNDNTYHSECDKSDCLFDFYDKLSTTTSQELYVDGSKASNGIGTKADPFNNIQEAIRRIKYQSTTIYLLNTEHKLQKDSTGGLDSLKKRNYQSLSIKPYYCQGTDTNCVENGKYPVVYLQSDSVTFTVYNQVYFEKVIFQHRYTFHSCSTCTSCGDLYSTSQSKVYLDDCDSFKNFEFFSVKSGGTLSFSNVTFQGMTMEYKSLIGMSGGSLKLTNVDFNYTIPLKTSSVIYASPSTGTTISLFEYNGGTISLLNFGYKINGSNSLGGFLYFEKIDEVSLSQLTFKNNILKSNQNYFMTFKSVKVLEIDNCIFKTNYATKSVIYIDQTDISKTYNDLSTVMITFSDNEFLYNILETYLSIDQGSDCLSYSIENNKYDSNVATSHFIYLKTTSKSQAPNSGNQACQSSNQFIIKGETFQTNSVESLFYLSFGGDIIIESLDAEKVYNGAIDSSTIFNDHFLPTFKDYSNTSSFPHGNSGQMLIYFSGSKSVTLTNLEAKEIKSSFVYFSSVETINIDGLTISDSSLTSGDGFIVAQSQKTMSIKNTKFTSLVSQMNQLGSIKPDSSTGSVTIENFELVSCQGGLKFEDCKTLTIKELSSRSCLNSKKPALSIKFSSESSLTITDSIFESGSSSVLTIESSTFKSIHLEISDLTIKDFETNDPLISIDSSVFLNNAKNNLISSSTFSNNQAQILSTSSSSGVLSVSSCNFIENNSSGYLFSVSGNSIVDLENCLFDSNIASSLIYLEMTSSLSYLKTISSTFENNQGKSIDVQNSHYKDAGSTFTNNSNDFGPVIFSDNGGVIILNETQISNNSAKQSGVIYLSSESQLYSSNILFEANSAVYKGGAIFCEKDSRIEIYESTFTKNKAEIGSAIFIQHINHNDSFISTSIFTENSANLSGCIYILETSLTLISSNIHDNTAHDAPSVVAMFNSKLYISDSKLYSHIGEGALLSIESKSFAKVIKSNFYDISSDDSTILSALKIYDSEFECFNCLFSGIRYEQGSLLSCSQSKCLLDSCKVRNIYTSYENKLIQVESSATLIVSSSSLENFIGSCIHLDSNTLAFISFSTFKSGYSDSGSGIYCKDCLNISVSNSSFQNLSSKQEGGSIYLNSESDYDSLIVDSSFFNCSSIGGGAVYIKNSRANFQNVIFTNNTSKVGTIGKGGAILIEQSSVSTNVSISNSIFKNNSAGESGGAIQWYLSKPILKNNKFQNNSAPYGADYASYSVNLSLQSSRFLESSSFVPGQIFESSFELRVIDHYGQVVKNDNSTTAQLTFIDQSNFSISGSSKSTSIEGVLTFGNFTIYGPPGSFPNLSIVPNFEHGPGLVPKIDLEVDLRKCIIGEVEETGLKCNECEPGYYNLKAGSQCLECPTGGKCYGGSKIVAAAGYWRYSKTTDTFFECPNPDSCLEEVYESTTENCKAGYKGNCCQSCALNYSRSSQNQCSKCLDHDRNSALLSGLLLILTLILIGITASNIKGAYKEESITSIYFKILMNYVQIVSLTISFDLSWPSFVKKMFEVQGKASGGSEQVLSVDCFLQSTMQPFFAKLIILSLIPLGCFIFSVLFWVLWGKLKKSNNVKEKFIGSIIVQLFFFQPNLVESNFSIFNCSELAPGEFYMTEEMSIKCWSGKHLTYTLGVAVPSLLIWCIGVPVLLVVFLTKNRSNLDQITEKLKYGFLYKGFKPEQFYWEFIIMLKKMLIISASVFLRNVSVPVQALVTFIIILSGYVLQEKLKPYSFKQLNLMELRAILVSAVTIYSGLFFLTGDLSDEGKIMMFVMMILSNIVFLSYWGYFTFGYYIGKVYLKFACCKKCFKGKLDVWVTQIVPDAPTDKTEKSMKESDADPDPNNSFSKIFSKRSELYTVKTSIQN